MRENRRYLIGRKKFRLEMGKGGPKTKADAIFQELKEHDGAPSPRMEDLDLWFDWKLIDRRASLRICLGIDFIAEIHRLTRCIAKAVNQDLEKRTTDFSITIEAMLDGSNLQGAWRALQACYKHASGRGSKPSHQDSKNMEVEYTALYKCTPSTCEPVPVMVDLFEVNDDVPSGEDIEDAVLSLKPRKEPGPTRIRAEHLKEWLREAQMETHPYTQHWSLLVELVQLVFKLGQIQT
jgi:hypothetical protein